jgi:glycerol-3-phosphate O-acyltransferase
VVPVAINYDRVLEDRSLLRELDARQGGTPPPRLAQLGEVAHYAVWNAARLAGRRWQRYGRAAVLIGEPIPLGGWFEELASAGVDLYALPRPERLARVQALCDRVMSRIGDLVPVTPVPLVCAALQTFDRDFVPRDELVARIAELREVLGELNAQGLAGGGGIDDPADTFDRAYRLLRMRRVLARQGGGYLILPRGRELVSYYANSVAHLLGDYETAIRQRDALPADLAVVGAASRASRVDTPWRSG